MAAAFEQGWRSCAGRQIPGARKVRHAWMLDFCSRSLRQRLQEAG
ncbi:hypothetical protein C4K39_0770 [Pseudomonas sessilinigenes]|nr:hypothetical protein C4K39_0770 [Pseudomonas sessilinigenes]